MEGEYWEANLNPWSGFRFQVLGTLHPSWVPPGVVRHEARAPADQGWQRPFFEEHIPEHFAAAVEQNRPLLFRPMQSAVFNGPPAGALHELVRSAMAEGAFPPKVERACTLDGKREHFGFVDGISQPALDGLAGPPAKH